jgi:hypothetical protein
MESWAKSLLKGLLFCPSLLAFLFYVCRGFQFFKPLPRFVSTLGKVFYACKATGQTFVEESFCVHSKMQTHGFKFQNLNLNLDTPFNREKLKYSLVQLKNMNSRSVTNPAFNNQGLAILSLILLLPVLLVALMLCFAVMTIQFHKTTWVDQCRESLIKIQNKNAEYMTQLLSLNPRSQQLRFDVALTEQKILLAMSTGQLEALPLLKLRLKYLKSQQKSLDIYQKKIVRNAKRVAEKAILRASGELNKKIKSDYLRSQGWIIMNSKPAPIPQAVFALKPDDQNLAPSYSPYLNFERRQSLALSWQTKYKWPEIIRLTSETTIHSQCRISIKEGVWRAIIQKDRL